MKLFRLSVRDEKDGHHGYRFHASKAKAEQAAKEARAQYDEPSECETEIEPIEITPTRAGILDALDRYGGHNDNG